MKKIFPIIIMSISVIALAGSAVGIVIAKNSGSKADPKVIPSHAHVNSYFEDDAFFHDQAAEYISNYEPKKDENVTVRLKVKRGYAKKVEVAYTFDYNKQNPTYYTNPMIFEKADDGMFYDYWIGTIPANEAPYQYHFNIENNVDSVYFNLDGINEGTPASSGADWSIRPEFSTPGWSQGALWYSIMPESFYNGNVFNDKTGAEWDTVWGGHNSWAGEWFGGDLAGINEKEDYLYNTLNITALFLNPIWITAHNAGYGCYDFYQIDSALGNDTDLLKLVSSLHDDELRIMLDAVFQYCNVNNILNNVSGMYPDLIGDLFNNFHQRDENGEKLESVWSGSIIDFSHEIARKTIYTEEQSVMLSYLIFFGIDAWRMDVGNTLSGTRANNWETATQILADMRPYLKEVSNEVLFLSEHADDNQLTDGILDSKWNYAFNKAVLDWCQGNSNARILSSGLKKALFYYPRGTTNSLYNFLSTHDTESFYSLIDYDKTTYLTANILMMSYPGSPCIYFGEETGQKSVDYTDSSTKLNAFYTAKNWDESTYDYDVFNTVRSLANLRKEYKNVLSTGGFMDLYNEAFNNENDIYAFARFNGDAVITVLNRNNKFVNDFTLDVSKLGYKDGTVLYDYLTGASYTVNKGKVTINIAASGSILTSKRNSNFVSTLEFEKTEDKTRIVKTDVDTYELSGEGSLLTSNYAYSIGFNNTAVSLTAKQINGTVGLVIKDFNSTNTYGISISNSKLTLNNDSSVTHEINPNDKITLVRDSNNICYISINNRILESSKKKIDFSEKIKLGIANISGVNKVTMTVEKLKEQLKTNFKESLGSLYTASNQNIIQTNENGLTLGKGYISSNAHACDFTYNAKFTITDISANEYAGIFIGSSLNDAFFFGFNGNNEKLVAGRLLNEKVIPYFEVSKNSKTVNIQVEKVGTTFSFVDRDTNEVIGTMNANYSNLCVGVINASAKSINVEYADFGDGETNKDFSHLGAINFDDSSYLDSSLSIGYKILQGVGFEYGYDKGAIVEAKNNEDSMYQFINKLKNYTATFSLKGTEALDDNSYYGVIFDTDANGDGGYLMKVNSTGLLTLENRSGVVLSSHQLVNYKNNELYQYHLEVIGNNIHVYNSNKECLLSYNQRTETNGYMAYISHNYSYALLSYNVYKQSGNIYQYEGSLYTSNKNGDISLELSSNNTFNYAGYRDQGYNNISVGFNLQINRSSPIKRGYYDFNIGVGVGDYYLNGLIVRFDDLGRLTIIEDGEKTITNQETGIKNPSSLYIVITCQNGKLFIDAVNYGETSYFSILSNYETKRDYRGAISYYSNNAMVRMNHIKGFSISDTENYKNLDSYLNIAMEEPIPPNPDPVNQPLTQNYENDFTKNSSLTTIDRYSGQISIDEGNLVINGAGTTNWDAGAAIASGTVHNFELEVRYKLGEVVASGGFAGVEFYKSSTAVNHQGSALTIIGYPTNWCGLFCGNGILTEYGTAVAVDENGYTTLHIRVVDGILTFDGGLESVTVNISTLPNNSDLRSGFISLNAGACLCYFDYVHVTILD